MNGGIVIKENFFSKKDIQILKGVALIMMLLHHFFGYPNWYIDGINLPNIGNNSDLFRYAFNPVSIFAFITGYTYFYSKNKNYKYSFTKIFDVLIPYWIILLILMIIGIITNTYTFELKTFLLEFFAIEMPIMRFCWYVLFYIIVIMLMPKISKFLDKSNILESIAIIIITVVIFNCILLYYNDNAKIVDIMYNLARFFPSVIIGYVFAKNNTFYKIDENIFKNKYLKFVLCIFIIYATLKFKQIFPNILIFDIQYIEQYYQIKLNLDIIYIPFFLYAIKIITMTVKPVVFNPLAFIGKYSLLIWFIHCIFFNVSQSIFMPILFFNNNPIIIVLIGLSISLIIAIIINPIITLLINYKNKILKK